MGKNVSELSLAQLQKQVVFFIEIVFENVGLKKKKKKNPSRCKQPLNISAVISGDIHELTFSWPVTVTISEKVSPGYTER